MPRYKELDPPKLERIRRIKQLMAQGKWVRGITQMELAEEWKCAASTVAGDAAEASRALIRDVDEEPGEIRAMLLTMFATHIKEFQEIADEVKTDPFETHSRISALRGKTEALQAFCRAWCTMPKDQEQVVVPVALEQLTTLLLAHGMKVIKADLPPKQFEDKSDGEDE